MIHQFQVSQHDYLLLLNIPVPILLEHGEMINIKTPSLYEYYTDTPYRKLEALFLTDIEDISENPQNVGFIADTYSDILIGLAIREADKDILEAFKKVTGCEVTKQGITFNGVVLTENDILEIRTTLLISNNRLEINGQEKEEESEFEKRMREMEEKINRVKKETKSEKEIPYIRMILFIMYELGSSAEEIKNLNAYGIKELYSFSYLASADKIQKIAAGNGNLGEKNPYKGILSINEVKE